LVDLFLGKGIAGNNETHQCNEEANKCNSFHGFKVQKKPLPKGSGFAITKAIN